jgi:hypothetical protein
MKGGSTEWLKLEEARLQEGHTTSLKSLCRREILLILPGFPHPW